MTGGYAVRARQAAVPPGSGGGQCWYISWSSVRVPGGLRAGLGSILAVSLAFGALAAALASCLRPGRARP